MIKELQYPFDVNYILSKSKKIRRSLLEENSNFTKKKIAILGGSTTYNIKNILDLFLLNYGIEAKFYESEYNKYYEDAIFPNPRLLDFGPDIIYICTSNRNITCYPAIVDSIETIEANISNDITKFKSIWNNLSKNYNCPIIQNNFEMPFYRLLGNRDASDPHGAVYYINRLNMEFYQYARENENFYICDINYLSADYGLKKWSDPFYYHMYKYALNIEAIPYLSFEISKIIKSIFGKNKKGFVLDLDNTLWGGTIGDDGVENILLGHEEAEGQAYVEFQKYIKQHQQLGIVLSIDSKNDYENAIIGLSHPDSEFTKDDFICIKANWDSKDKNFQDIARELNVMPDSLVFVDDNPAERYIITQQIPGVCAPEIGEVHNYIQNIDRNGYFEVTSLSQDDLKRNNMYKENAKREKFQSSFKNYSDYLISLEMKAQITDFSCLYYGRIAQLTNKSNQFNLTTRRYTQSEIEQIAKDRCYIHLCGKLEDRFGDNGIVSIIIGHQIENICHIDLWLMSCRVLKRDMEYAMMDELIQKCKKRKLDKIIGYYYPTAKNQMVKDFYKVLGFEMIEEDNEGGTVWCFDLNHKYEKMNKYICVQSERR